MMACPSSFSSDGLELEGLCDRARFSRGSIVADLAGDDVNERGARRGW